MIPICAEFHTIDNNYLLLTDIPQTIARNKYM